MATEVTRLLARLEARSPDPGTAVAQLGDALKREALPERKLGQIGRTLSRLADHEDWRVRLAVARALEHFRHDSFERIACKLVDDEQSYVRTAARTVLSDRTQAERTDVLREEHDEVLRDWLGDLERKHGKQARDAAAKTARKFTELVLREAYHEFVKVQTPLELDLRSVILVHSRGRKRGDDCLESLAAALGRVKLMGRILRSLRELMTEVRPRFRVEKLRDVVQQARDLALEGGQPSGFEIDVPARLSVEVDRERLVLALSNVLRNALESYERRRGPVRVRARCVQDRVILTVNDRGCGMREDARKAAFRLFSSKKTESIGFGLPFARKIIESEHRGTIRLTSEVGVGTEVTLAIPRTQEAHVS